MSDDRLYVIVAEDGSVLDYAMLFTDRYVMVPKWYYEGVLRGTLVPATIT